MQEMAHLHMIAARDRLRTIQPWACGFNLSVVFSPVCVALLQKGAPPQSWSMAGLSALSLLLPLFLLRRWGPYFVLLLPVTLVGLIYQGYLLEYGALTNSDALMLAMNSSVEEVWGAIQVFGLLGQFYAGIAVLATYVAATFLCWHRPVDYKVWIRRPRHILMFAVALALPYLASTVQARKADVAEQILLASVWSHPIGVLEYVGASLPEVLELQGRSVKKRPYHVQSATTDNSIFIFIIGESARFDAFHINGYKAPTSPELEKLGVISLSRAFSTANLTMHAVPMMMTGLAPSAYQPELIHGSLLDLFAEAGYRTAWLLNQDIGVGRPFGPAPHTFFYPLDGKQNNYGRALPDQVLLPKLASLLAQASGPQFIAMHTSGSHWEYGRRYPADFDQQSPHLSTDAAMINFPNDGNAGPRFRREYDTSIRYSDWFIGQTIRLASASGRPAVVLYASDHGENFKASDGYDGHGIPELSPGDLRIPVFVWASTAYQNAHAEKWQALIGNSSKTFTSDGVFHTLADLAGLRFDELDLGRSLGARQFRPQPNPVFKVGGRLIPLDQCRRCP